MRLGDGHQKRVELVEERRIPGQLPLDDAPELLVADVRRHDPMPREHAPRVGVGDEDRPVQSIEQDGVGGLGADAGHLQELGSQGLERRPSQPVEPPPASRQEKDRERAETPRLETPGSRWTYEPPEPRQRQPGQPPGCEPPSRAEIVYGPLGAGPGGMLGQDGAHGDFEAAPGRPPVLGAVAGVQRHIEAQETAAQAHGEA